MAMKTRDYYWVKQLKVVLVLDLIFVLLAMLIDYQFFKDNLPFDVLALIWPLIWLPYFSKSVRVEKVFLGHIPADPLPVSADRLLILRSLAGLARLCRGLVILNH